MCRKNFSFKCHRDDAKNVYAVNDISFHPVHGTFSTAGADGTVSFWDKDSKQRLKPFPKTNGQISSTAFNRNGSIFAYGVSYDWSKVTFFSYVILTKSLISIHRVINKHYHQIPSRFICTL